MLAVPCARLLLSPVALGVPVALAVLAFLADLGPPLSHAHPSSPVVWMQCEMGMATTPCPHLCLHPAATWGTTGQPHRYSPLRRGQQDLAAPGCQGGPGDRERGFSRRQSPSVWGHSPIALPTPSWCTSREQSHLQ